jgi:hypothetical protein
LWSDSKLLAYRFNSKAYFSDGQCQFQSARAGMLTGKPAKNLTSDGALYVLGLQCKTKRMGTGKCASKTPLRKALNVLFHIPLTV